MLVVAGRGSRAEKVSVVVEVVVCKREVGATGDRESVDTGPTEKRGGGGGLYTKKEE